MCVVVCGESEAGKTRFTKAMSLMSNVGWYISDWELRSYGEEATEVVNVAKISSTEQDCKTELEVLDLGGHREYRHTSQIFMRMAAFYILIGNVLTMEVNGAGSSEIRSWLCSIRQQNSNASVLIVLTHKDKRDNSLYLETVTCTVNSVLEEGKCVGLCEGQSVQDNICWYCGEKPQIRPRNDKNSLHDYPHIAGFITASSATAEGVQSMYSKLKNTTKTVLGTQCHSLSKGTLAVAGYLKDAVQTKVTEMQGSNKEYDKSPEHGLPYISSEELSRFVETVADSSDSSGSHRDIIKQLESRGVIIGSASEKPAIYFLNKTLLAGALKQIIKHNARETADTIYHLDKIPFWKEFTSNHKVCGGHLKALLANYNLLASNESQLLPSAIPPNHDVWNSLRASLRLGCELKVRNNVVQVRETLFASLVCTIPDVKTPEEFEKTCTSFFQNGVQIQGQCHGECCDLTLAVSRPYWTEENGDTIEFIVCLATNAYQSDDKGSEVKKTAGTFAYEAIRTAAANTNFVEVLTEGFYIKCPECPISCYGAKVDIGTEYLHFTGTGMKLASFPGSPNCLHCRTPTLTPHRSAVLAPSVTNLEHQETVIIAVFFHHQTNWLWRDTWIGVPLCRQCLHFASTKDPNGKHPDYFKLSGGFISTLKPKPETRLILFMAVMKGTEAQKARWILKKDAKSLLETLKRLQEHMDATNNAFEAFKCFKHRGDEDRTANRTDSPKVWGEVEKTITKVRDEGYCGLGERLQTDEYEGKHFHFCRSHFQFDF